ncbi:MAG TPA: SH3 domain-containing protein [Anaerolineae bacterium]|nr:SH3 domain-containing protein [Anaerolineae bacterium]
MTRLTSRWLLLIVTLALVACSPTPAPATQASTLAAAPAASAAPPSPTPTAASSPPSLALASIPNPFERRHLAAGMPIAENGMFFMDVATGAIDAWTLRADDNPWPAYSASPDNRWVIALADDAAYAVERHSGAAFRWARNSTYQPVAQGDSLLFRDDGRQVWAVGTARPAPAPLPCGPADGLALSLDGRTAAVVVGHALYLVQMADLACRQVADVAVPAGSSLEYLYLQTERGGDAFTVNLDLSIGAGTAHTSRLQVERYSWQGERLGELTLPAGILSPDRRWVAWGEALSDAVPAVVVADAATLTPRFRVVGASLCFWDYGGGQWLADSSAFVVRTGAEYRMVTLDGRLSAAPTLGAPGDLEGMTDEPLPAPDRADLFAIGRRAVVDANGNCLARPELGEAGSDWSYPADISPWGLDSAEMRFALPHFGHGGHCGEAEYQLPARVELAPFSPLVLAVGLPAGECVNLRAAPGKKAELLTCLPGGTRLSLAPLAETHQAEGQEPYYLSRSLAWASESQWLRVRAPDGQEGWVDAKAGNVGWAP